MENIELITIDQSAQLSQKIAQHLGKTLHTAKVQMFADGEMYVGLTNPELWRNKRAVIIQSTAIPVSDHILQVSFLAHELKNAGADWVVAVEPYFGYSRQERSDIIGMSGPAQVIAHLYQGAQIDQMMMVDLHTSVIQSFFVIPTYNILVEDVIANHIRNTFDTGSTCLIAPDKGAEKRISAIAQKINGAFSVFEKERYGRDKTRIVGQIGSCTGSRAIIIDDIIDTGGTAIQAAEQLLAQGFDKVYGYFVHGVFSGDALERIAKSPFTKIFVSNTIEQKRELPKKVEVFDVSTRVAQCMKEHV